MNPVQLATQSESLQALVLLLQYIQGVCHKNKQDEENVKINAEVKKIMHGHDGDLSIGNWVLYRGVDSDNYYLRFMIGKSYLIIIKKMPPKT